MLVPVSLKGARTNHLIVGKVPKRGAISGEGRVIRGVRVAAVVSEPNVIACIQTHRLAK